MLFKEIYLDSGATTKVDKKVLETMMHYYENAYGNASSTHSFGQDAKEALNTARKYIAKSINADPSEIVFTSGGTEANNMVMKGIAFENKEKGNHIITTKVEHKCILNAAKWLETQGFKVTYLDVDKFGFIDILELEKAITDKTILVSIIHGNNEIGTINDIDEIGELCKKKNIYFHTDACQSYTKVPIDVKKTNVDMMTLNAHKIYGPKGVGALYIKNGTKITPLIHGGGHENGHRSGTENIPGVVGFAKAVEVSEDKKTKFRIKTMRDNLISNLLQIEGVELNGANGDERLLNNVNICVKDVDGDSLGNMLSSKGICSSKGSACSANVSEPSYVLKAIGRTDEEAFSSIRFTLSKFTSEKDLNYVIKIMPIIIKKLRKKGIIGKIMDKI